MTQVTEDVVAFDLDHTILDTEDALFSPILQRVAEETGQPLTLVIEIFNRVNETTFSWENFFTALEIPTDKARQLREEFEADIRSRIDFCLYPGIVKVLWECKRRSRLVLVTAGDAAWQRWKFEQSALLHDLFDPADQHFVPLRGSKAACLERYQRQFGRLAFVDDSVRWHVEVVTRLDVRCIRLVWPRPGKSQMHEGDGQLWKVARNADELRRQLWEE